MSLRRDCRHGGRIARAEFVRSVRRYFRDARRIAGLGIAALFLGGNLLLALPSVQALGGRVGSVGSIPYFGPVTTLLPVGLVLLGALRTVERIGGVDGEDFLLTAVHPRAVVLGLIAAEIARLLLWFGLPILAVAGAFAAGLGTPLLLVGGTLVLVPLVCSAAVWGYAVGIGVLRLLRHLPRFRRVLKVGGIVLLVAFVVLSQVGVQYVASSDVSLLGLVGVLAVAPLTEYATLAFLGTPLAAPVTPGALAVLISLIALTPVGLAVAERQATALWFTDGPSGDEPAQERTDTPAPASGFAPPRPFAWTTTGIIAWGHLVRTVRHPQNLAHLLMLVFFAGPFLGGFTQGSGSDHALLLGGAGVVVGVYLAGATFGLNPLGDDRPVLPLVLLTETEPRTFLRGRLAAGLAVGVPVAVLAPLGSTALGASPLCALAFAVAGSGFCVTAGLFALGLGCAYPIYEKRKIWGAETVAPSTLVLLGYTSVVVGGAAIGLVFTFLGVTENFGPTGVVVVLLAVYLLLTLGVPYISYRYARQRYRKYTLD